MAKELVARTSLSYRAAQIGARPEFQIDGTVAPNTYTFSVSGGVVFSATVPLIKTHLQIPSGGVNFSGTVPLLKTRVQIPAGGVVFSGAATLIKTKIESASGGVVFGGTAPLVREEVLQPGGGVVFGGTGVMQFIPAGGTGANPDYKKFHIGIGRSSRLS